MPRTKSAKKALRVSKKKQTRNYALRAKFKSAIKQFLSKKEKTQKDLTEVVSIIDKTVKAKIIHANKAGRLKSRLAKSGVKSSLVSKAKPVKPAKKKSVKKKTK